MKENRKRWGCWVFYILLAFWLFLFGNGLTAGSVKEISPTELYQAIEEGRVKSFTLNRSTGDVSGQFTDDKLFETKVASPVELEKLAIAKGVPFEVEEPSGWSVFLLSLVPMLLFMALIYFFFLRPAMGGQGMNQFGGLTANKARVSHERPKVTFNDVAGCDSAKEEVREVVEFLNNPKKYQRIGARIPRGVLLVGPPGCGKTMLAKAVANAAGAVFMEISGSDFVEVFVGAGAGRVRSLFEDARKQNKCVIFIDELDAVGGRRYNGLRHGGHDEREQTLNELLAQMDGFSDRSNVVVLAATNRPEILDPALLRPGRFDRKVLVDLPDVKGREEILTVHIRKVTSLADDVNLKLIAEESPGFSGAELEDLINEAMISAIRNEQESVRHVDLEEAIDIVLWGRERKISLSKDEEELCAYHEIGHTLVAMKLLGSQSVRKVTIVPRAKSLGATHFHNDGKEYITRKELYINHLAASMGGRAAEVIKFNAETTGACSDFQNATEMAKRMICEWGMSEKIGKVVFQQSSFLGAGQIEGSEWAKQIIDEEVRRLLDEAYKKATAILNENKDLMDKLAGELLIRKTIRNAELKKLFETTNLG